MSVLLRTALVFTLLSGTSFAADPPVPSFPSLFGQWKAVRILAFGDITGSDRSGKAGLGATVTISKDKISNTYEPSASCSPQNAKVVLEDTEAKLNQDFGTSIRNVRLPRGTLKPRMPYLEAGCALALVINRNEMMWPLGNGFFYLIQRLPG